MGMFRFVRAVVYCYLAYVAFGVGMTWESQAHPQKASVILGQGIKYDGLLSRTWTGDAQLHLADGNELIFSPDKAAIAIFPRDVERRSTLGMWRAWLPLAVWAVYGLVRTLRVPKQQ